MRCCNSMPRRFRRISRCSARSAADTKTRTSSDLPIGCGDDTMNANVGPAAPASTNGKRTKILILIAVIFIVLGALWAAYWVLVLAKREQTDDAYVNGNKVVISAQVSGTVMAVLADDTQLAKAGQVLVRLDPVDAQTSLDRSASALAQTVRQVRQEKSMRGSIRFGHRNPAVGACACRGGPGKARATAGRPRDCARGSAARARKRGNGARRAEPGRAPVERLARAWSTGRRCKNNPAVLQAKAAYRDAWIAAHRNAVVAPVTGYVAERSVQLGQHIQAGSGAHDRDPAQCAVGRCEFQGSSAAPSAHRSAGRGAQRSLRRLLHISRPRQGYGGRNRRRFRAAAGAKRLRQLDQSGAASAGADSDRR